MQATFIHFLREKEFHTFFKNSFEPKFSKTYLLPKIVRHYFVPLQNYSHPYTFHLTHTHGIKNEASLTRVFIFNKLITKICHTFRFSKNWVMYIMKAIWLRWLSGIMQYAIHSSQQSFRINYLSLFISRCAKNSQGQIKTDFVAVCRCEPLSQMYYRLSHNIKTACFWRK